MALKETDYTKVVQAAGSVKKQGKIPSITNVCEELGMISPTPNLPALLEQWFHTQPEFQRSIPAPLSENITIKAVNLFEKILN